MVNIYGGRYIELVAMGLSTNVHITWGHHLVGVKTQLYPLVAIDDHPKKHEKSCRF